MVGLVFCLCQATTASILVSCERVLIMIVLLMVSEGL